MKRVVVVGVTGSGKSTLARQLSQILDAPHIELDSLYWQPNWEPSLVYEFRDKVQAVVSSEYWVIDGNYRAVRDIVWRNADTVIWLDYPLWLIACRLMPRTIRRIISQENLWGTGNRESWRKQFFSRDPLILWMFKTYPRQKREYPMLFKQPEYAHLKVVHLRSPRQTENWLEQVKNNV